MLENIKYLILDFGKVLAGPATGEWFITPNFWNIIGKETISQDKLMNIINKYGFMIGQKAVTEEEEYQMFFKFYKKILEDIQKLEDVELKAMQLAKDFVYRDDKYTLYPDTVKNLERLSKKYTLLLLSDNWPCAFRIMKNWDIDKYFEKLYISSVYHCQKKDKIFFDFPIQDYNIDVKKAAFVDDNINLLDVANEKGFYPILMNRDNQSRDFRYTTILSLDELK